MTNDGKNEEKNENLLVRNNTNDLNENISMKDESLLNKDILNILESPTLNNSIVAIFFLILEKEEEVFKPIIKFFWRKRLCKKGVRKFFLKKEFKIKPGKKLRGLRNKTLKS